MTESRKTQMPPRAFRGQPPHVQSGPGQDRLVGQPQPWQARNLGRQHQPAPSSPVGRLQRNADRKGVV